MFFPHRRRVFFFLVFFGFPSLAHAHPPVSLVMDRSGRVFFSDLENVWMIAKTGQVSIAVRNVHTHELWLDPVGTLVGEDVRNQGENYRHRVWARKPDGTQNDKIPWRSGFPHDFNDYSFVRDADGNHWVVDRSARNVVTIKNGRVSRRVPFSPKGFVHWSTLDQQGNYFLSVGESVFVLPPSGRSFRLLATGLAETSEEFDFVTARHSVMGLWPDRRGGVFVAIFSGQVVKHIDTNGNVTDVLRRYGSWSPVGGMLANDGSLWIQEWSGSNKTRVRQIQPGGKIIEYAPN